MTGQTYTWPSSTYIAEPPFFADFALKTGANNVDATAANTLKRTELSTAASAPATADETAANETAASDESRGRAQPGTGPATK